MFGATPWRPTRGHRCRTPLPPSTRAQLWPGLAATISTRSVAIAVTISGDTASASTCGRPSPTPRPGWTTAAPSRSWVAPSTPFGEITGTTSGDSRRCPLTPRRPRPRQLRRLRPLLPRRRCPRPRPRPGRSGPTWMTRPLTLARAGPSRPTAPIFTLYAAAARGHSGHSTSATASGPPCPTRPPTSPAARPLLTPEGSSTRSTAGTPIRSGASTSAAQAGRHEPMPPMAWIGAALWLGTDRIRSTPSVATTSRTSGDTGYRPTRGRHSQTHLLTWTREALSPTSTGTSTRSGDRTGRTSGAITSAATPGRGSPLRPRMSMKAALWLGTAETSSSACQGTSARVSGATALAAASGKSWTARIGISMTAEPWSTWTELSMP